MWRCTLLLDAGDECKETAPKNNVKKIDVVIPLDKLEAFQRKLIESGNVLQIITKPTGRDNNVSVSIYFAVMDLTDQIRRIGEEIQASADEITDQVKWLKANAHK